MKVDAGVTELAGNTDNTIWNKRCNYSATIHLDFKE